MITLTPAGIQKIKDQNTTIIRVGVKGGGCNSYTFHLSLENNIAKENDLIFTQDNITILCDPKSHQFLDGTVIDYLETLNYVGFKFNAPGVKGNCGCGWSVEF